MRLGCFIHLFTHNHIEENMSSVHFFHFFILQAKWWQSDGKVKKWKKWWQSNDIKIEVSYMRPQWEALWLFLWPFAISSVNIELLGALPGIMVKVAKTSSIYFSSKNVMTLIYMLLGNRTILTLSPKWAHLCIACNTVKTCVINQD